jgi:hypothetical protein
VLSLDLSMGMVRPLLIIGIFNSLTVPVEHKVTALVEAHSDHVLVLEHQVLALDNPVIFAWELFDRIAGRIWLIVRLPLARVHHLFDLDKSQIERSVLNALILHKFYLAEVTLVD